jgi:hypothetical protein
MVCMHTCSQAFDTEFLLDVEVCDAKGRLL